MQPATHVAAPQARQAPPRPGMVRIPGATFRMGSAQHYPEEAPVRRVRVETFWIDARPVTNRAFAQFVDATGWVTMAETPPGEDDYPGALPDMLVAASMVFTPTRGPVSLANHHAWWRFVPGTNWRHPLGPESSLDDLWDHPVVHVAWNDVEAFARWAGCDLPTEAEWEYAARGGLRDSEFAWGNKLNPNGRRMANVWEGRFPYENLAPDGWERTSPAGFYPANGFGLYDMIGNVWEWTKDWWALPSAAGCCSARRAQSHDPAQPDIPIPRKVIKGGSHLCAPSYCRRYRPAARHPHPVDTSTSHIGFRLVWRAAP